MVAVPTTAGTGAEVSAAAVFFNEEAGIKINLAMPFIEADMAVLDANLTVGLPGSAFGFAFACVLTYFLHYIFLLNW